MTTAVDWDVKHQFKQTKVTIQIMHLREPSNESNLLVSIAHLAKPENIIKKRKLTLNQMVVIFKNT